MKNCIDRFPGCARIGIYDSWVSKVCKDWHMIHGFPGIKEERVRGLAFDSLTRLEKRIGFGNDSI